jgi:hypothetical protein
MSQLIIISKYAYSVIIISYFSLSNLTVMLKEQMG